MTLKKFLGYLSISFPESPMFDFIVIELISKLNFGFTNILGLAAYISKVTVAFQSHSLKSYFES